jgi:alanyl-tRNA synthetase
VNANLNAGPTMSSRSSTPCSRTRRSREAAPGLRTEGPRPAREELAAKATERDGLKFVSAVVTVDQEVAQPRFAGPRQARRRRRQLGAALGDKASLVAFCSPAAIKAGHQAGKIIQGTQRRKIGGKGGGKPDFAMGGGKDIAKLAAVILLPFGFFPLITSFPPGWI